MVADDPVLDPVTLPEGNRLPFLSDSPLVRCLTCSQLLTPEGYVSDGHPCYVGGGAIFGSVLFEADDEETGIEVEVELGIGWVAAIMAATLTAIVVDSLFGVAAWIRK